MMVMISTTTIALVAVVIAGVAMIITTWKYECGNENDINNHNKVTIVGRERKSRKSTMTRSQRIISSSSSSRESAAAATRSTGTVDRCAPTCIRL